MHVLFEANIGCVACCKSSLEDIRSHQFDWEAAGRMDYREILKFVLYHPPQFPKHANRIGIIGVVIFFVDCLSDDLFKDKNRL
jgi:hypothetical protein